MNTPDGLVANYREWYAVVLARFVFALGAVLYFYAALPIMEQGDFQAKAHISAMMLYIVYGGYTAIMLKPSLFITYKAKPLRVVIPVQHWRKGGLSDISKYPPREGKAGYVYLIQELNDGHFKIGRTRNPNNRFETFGVKLPAKIDYICLIPTEDTHLLENNLHWHFKHRHVAGEWFALSDEDVASIIALAQKAED